MAKFGYISCDQCNKKLLRTRKKIEKGEEVKLSTMMRLGKTPKVNKFADLYCSCGSVSFKLVRE